MIISTELVKSERQFLATNYDSEPHNAWGANLSRYPAGPPLRRVADVGAWRLLRVDEISEIVRVFWICLY